MAQKATSLLTGVNRDQTGLGLNDPALRKTSRCQLQRFRIGGSDNGKGLAKREIKNQICPIVNVHLFASIGSVAG